MSAKYDSIGIDYNMTRSADPYLASRMSDLLGVTAGRRMLDLGCGTGNYTCALAKSGAQFIGVDPSAVMLEKARATSEEIQWLQGTAEEIPLEKESVDGVLASLTTHHWSSIEQGMNEVFRVLQPGCPVLVFTSTPAQMENYWLRHYFPVAIQKSMEQMPSLEVTTNALTKSGFENIQLEIYNVKEDLQDLFLLSGKHNPEIYFDEQFRKGISTFSSLARQEEIDEGLLRLRADINSGKIQKVMNSCDDSIGDYLFIQAFKPKS